MHLLASILSSILLFVSSFFGHPATPQFGSYNPTGGGTYRLQTSIGTSNTSITLSSFKEPISNIPYTMSYLNSSIEYGTLEPQSNNREFVSFTGITQNSDGTATLTGVTRGISSSFPFTASTTLQLAHPGQSIFIISNAPAFYAQQFLYANQVSTSSVGFIISSTSPPYFDSTGAQHTGTYISTTSEVASVDYVNKVAFSGAPNATESVKGISQLSTALQQASSTSLGSTAASLVLQAKYATDTPQSSCATGYSVAGAACSIIADLTGHIKQAWIDLTAAFTITGNWVFQGTVNILASVAKPFTLNGIAYVFPGFQNSSSTILATNGSGTLSWVNPSVKIIAIDSNLKTTSNTSTTTLEWATIPANTLTASSTLQVQAMCYNRTAFSTFEIKFGNGSASTTLAAVGDVGNSSTERMQAFLAATSTTAEGYTGEGYRPGSQTILQTDVGNTGNYTAYNTASNLFIAVNGANPSGGGTANCFGWLVEVMTQ